MEMRNRPTLNFRHLSHAISTEQETSGANAVDLNLGSCSYFVSLNIPFLIQGRQYIHDCQVYIQDRKIATYKFKIDNIHSRLNKLHFRFKTEVNSVLTYLFEI